MRIQVLQTAKVNMGAEVYESETPIIVINKEQFTTYIKTELQQSQKHDYHVFKIEQLLNLDNGKAVTVQTKRTTHYHKAIGIAVSMNA